MTFRSSRASLSDQTEPIRLWTFPAAGRTDVQIAGRRVDRRTRARTVSRSSGLEIENDDVRNVRQDRILHALVLGMSQIIVALLRALELHHEPVREVPIETFRARILAPL